MSNTQVGTIFSQIISDVVESSRVDFEEGGVDEHVLDELRQVRPFASFPLRDAVADLHFFIIYKLIFVSFLFLWHLAFFLSRRMSYFEAQSDGGS